MKGMDLSRAYCERYAASLFAGGLEGLRQRCALGLVGPGSECLGFDDQISRDHDFGPGFCIWLEPADFAAFGAELQRRYDELPREFMGYRRVSTPLSGKRTGVFDADEFRMRYTGLASAPSSSKEWLFIPQQLLAEFTAGEIFSDPAGVMARRRAPYLAFYPQAVVQKKVAAELAGMAQAGQYNLLRSLKRGETATAMLAAARFSEQAVSMTFLLNKRYMPFYKWAHRGVEQLPILGRETAVCVTALAGLDWRLGPRVEAVAGDIVESLCRDVAGRLRSDGLSDADGDWLVEHGPSVQARIETPELQRMSVMLE